MNNTVKGISGQICFPCNLGPCVCFAFSCMKKQVNARDVFSLIAVCCTCLAESSLDLSTTSMMETLFAKISFHRV